jgi:hypothetical protein
MRTQIGYYGYVDFYGDSAKQSCFNQALYVYGQAIIGYIYLDSGNGLYYTTSTGTDLANNGTYLTTLGGNPWDNPANVYTEVRDQIQPTTTIAPTTTVSPTTTAFPTTIAPTTTVSPTTIAPTTTVFLLSIDCAIYDEDYTVSHEEVAYSVPDWDIVLITLYNDGENVWYLDDAYIDLATGMFVANYDETHYKWYKILDGIVLEQGIALKSDLVPTTTIAPTTTVTPTHGLYLYKEIKSKGGRTIRVEIWKKGFSSSAMEITAMGVPAVVIETDNIDGEPLTPIVKTSATIIIKDTAQIDYTEFFTSDATKYKVIIKVDGNTLWGGYVTPDSFSQSLSYRSDVVLTVRDNIGLLANIDFDYPYRYFSISNFLSYVFNKIGFLCSLDTSRVLKQDENNISILSGIVFSEIFEKGTLYEALEIILRGIGCQIRFVGDNTYALFDIGKISSYGSTVTSQSFIFIEQSGILDIVPAYKELNISQDYHFNDDIFIGFPKAEKYDYSDQKIIAGLTVNFYDLLFAGSWSGNLRIVKPTEWNLGIDRLLITGDDYSLIADRPYAGFQVSVDRVDSNIKISFSVSNTVKKFSSSRTEPPYNLLENYLHRDVDTGYSYRLKIRCNVFLYTSTKTYVMYDTWEEYDSLITKYIEFDLESGGNPGSGIQTITGKVDNMKDIGLEINIDHVPEPGILLIRFYPWMIIEGSLRSAISTDYVVSIKDIKMVLDSPNAAEGIEKKYIILPEANIKGELSLDIGEVPVNLNNNLTHKGGIFRYADYFPPMRGFHYSTSILKYYLYDFISYEVAHFFSKQKRRLSGKIINDASLTNMISFGKPFVYDGKTYILNYGSMDMLEEVMDVQLIEAEDYTPAAPTTTVVPTTLAPTTTLTPTTLVPTTLEPTTTKAPTTLAPTTTIPQTTTITPTTTAAPTTTVTPTTTVAHEEIEYAMYDSDYTVSQADVAATVVNWSFVYGTLYSSGNDVWYFDSSYQNLATGMFVADYDETYYEWYQILNGTILEQGLGFKSGLIATTTLAPTTTTIAPTTTATPTTTIAPTTTVTPTTTASPTTTVAPTTTMASTIDYEAYSEDYDTSHLDVADAVENWDVALGTLYNGGGNIFYFESSHQNLATGMFVSNYDDTHYKWYKIMDGVVTAQGTALKP